MLRPIMLLTQPKHRRPRTSLFGHYRSLPVLCDPATQSSYICLNGNGIIHIVNWSCTLSLSSRERCKWSPNPFRPRRKPFRTTWASSRKPQYPSGMLSLIQYVGDVHSSVPHRKEAWRRWNAYDSRPIRPDGQSCGIWLVNSIELEQRTLGTTSILSLSS